MVDRANIGTGTERKQNQAHGEAPSLLRTSRPARSLGVFFCPKSGLTIADKQALAQQMIDNPTMPESIVWGTLKDKQTGFDVRRQVLMFGYIADFYIRKLKLVIEIDGSAHKGREEYDARRDKVMQDNGIQVKRFTNRGVYLNPNVVFEYLSKGLYLTDIPKVARNKQPIIRGRHRKSKPIKVRYLTPRQKKRIRLQDVLVPEPFTKQPSKFRRSRKTPEDWAKISPMSSRVPW
jgi:very-short-patch-repair endonuclease